MKLIESISEHSNSIPKSTIYYDYSILHTLSQSNMLAKRDETFQSMVIQVWKEYMKKQQANDYLQMEEWCLDGRKEGPFTSKGKTHIVIEGLLSS